MSLVVRAAAAAALLAATLPGCAPLPQLRAQWYLGEESATMASTFYVVILNEGHRPTRIAEVALKRRTRQDWKADRTPIARNSQYVEQHVIFREREFDSKPITLDPGYPLPILTPLLGDIAHRCRLPVRLFVRQDLRSRRVHVVEIARALPSSVPENWVAPVGCRVLSGEIGTESVPTPPTHPDPIK